MENGRIEADRRSSKAQWIKLGLVVLMQLLDSTILQPSVYLQSLVRGFISTCICTAPACACQVSAAACVGLAGNRFIIT